MTRQEWGEKILKAKVPKWFKGCLGAAANRAPTNTGDGTVYGSYAGAGYELGRHIGEFVEVGDLEQLAEIQDEEASVTEWLREHAERFIELVPARRRPKFVEGFVQCIQDRGVL